MDENNQYGNAMTKPLSYGCIKKLKKTPSLCEYNIILSSLSHKGPCYLMKFIRPNLKNERSQKLINVLFFYERFEDLK